MKRCLVSPIILLLSSSLTLAQNTTSNCVPACDSDQVCEQVFNTNNQYQCTSRLSPAAASLSPASSACGSGCAQGQTCQQVYNTNDQYECVSSSTSSSSDSPFTAPTASASSNSSGCNPACSANELCRQVYNTDGQYECVAVSSPIQAAGISPTAAAVNTTASSTSTGCDPACTTGEVCRQVYNTDNQYECVAATSPSATATALSPQTILASCPDNASNCQECSNGSYCLNGGTCTEDGQCSCGLLISSLHCNSTALAETTSDTHSKSLTTGAITGIVLGSVAGVTVLLAALFAGIYKIYGRPASYTRYKEDLYSPSTIP